MKVEEHKQNWGSKKSDWMLRDRLFEESAGTEVRSTACSGGLRSLGWEGAMCSWAGQSF